MQRRALLVHGMFMTGASWALWVKRFEARGIEAVAPSWPGREATPGELRRSPPARLSTLTLAEVVAQFEAEARRLGPDLFIIGHSMGGLVTQLLLGRGLGRGGVAIDSAPPQGVRSLALSHLRANAPVLWPGSAPINPSFEQWKYAFWHTASDADAQVMFDREVVPESRLVGRGPLGPEGRVDFSARRAPLMLIAGELDHIIPPALNRANAARYEQAVAPTELVELPGKTHALCGAPGWEAVADACLDFLSRH
jgi:pimeloyl-ACP methyl ester carboxylesterase